MTNENQQNEAEQKAIAKAKAAVAHDPTNFETHLKLGEMFFNADQIQEALAAFQQAKEHNPDSTLVFYWLGRAYERLGPVQAALEAHERALFLDPTNVGSHVGLGILYFDQLHDYEAAIEAFQSGLEHDPEDAFAVALLGITLARMGHFEKAIASLQEALRLEPENPFALGNLSILYLHRKQYEQMIATCQREIEIADGNDAHRLLGFVFAHQELHEKAIQEFKKALALEPKDYEARGALARAYQSLGRQQEAEAELEIAQDGARQDKEYGLACLEAVLGNFEQALPLLKEALQKDQVEAGWAQLDPEFAFMTDRPGFIALFQN